MKVICAWCGRGLGEKPPYDDKRISHGMCGECEKKLELEDEKEKDIKDSSSL